MPSLPPVEERPSLLDRSAVAGRRVAYAVGADARVSLRVLVFLVVAALAVSFAPVPWAQLGLIALVGLALDWARTKRGSM